MNAAGNLDLLKHRHI